MNRQTQSRRIVGILGVAMMISLAACNRPAEGANSPDGADMASAGGGMRLDISVAESADEERSETAPKSRAAQQAITLLAGQTAVAAHLANYDDWSGEAWPEDEERGEWGVDL